MAMLTITESALGHLADALRSVNGPDPALLSKLGNADAQGSWAAVMGNGEWLTTI